MSFQVRSKFLPRAKITKWFPGHMLRGMRVMQSRLKRVDCLIEVHDARIPFTGRNSDLHSMMVAKPHVLILNKMDLADPEYMPKVQTTLAKKAGTRVLYTDTLKGRGCKQILQTVLELVRESDRFNRADSQDISLMIVGIPNVGKSSIINKLRTFYSKHSINRTPARVGPQAGVTTSVMEKIKICENPPVYLYDTPGVLHPRENKTEAILRMAVCSTMSDDVIGVETIADYLLYWFNKRNIFTYVDQYHLKEPTDNIDELLFHLSTNLGFIKQVTVQGGEQRKVFDMSSASARFLKDFREGVLGRFVLDDHLLRS